MINNQGRETRRFRKGSGCFDCQMCGKKTRDAGDNGDVGLCPVCYEKAGDENMVSDGHMTQAEFDEKWKELGL